MKLWLDDIRRPPDDSWAWARTNAQAQVLLEGGEVVEVSLDHDLGLHEADPDAPDAIYGRGASPDGSGLDLVLWMCERGLVPERVTIHSWNPAGAKRMAQALADYGHRGVVVPFRPPRGLVL